MQTTQDTVNEAIRKAALIEQLVQSNGWRELMEIVNNLIAQEQAQLSGQRLDGSYYKKIGFLQSLVYFKEIPNIVKDKKIREYLLSQGRELGFKTVQKLPQYFFEGRQQANQVMRQMSGKDSELQLKEKKEWLERSKTA